MPYVGTTAPDGWLMCDGGSIPAEYANLRAMVGANTPNLRGKFLGGANGNGLTLKSSYSDTTRKPRNSSFSLTVDTRHRHSFDITKNGISTSSGGSHTHTITSNLFVNKDNSGANKGNKVNFNRTNYNSGSASSLSANSGGSHSHTFDLSVTGINTDYQGSSSKSVSNSNWDSYTRPHTYAVNYIIKHD
jgi:microcystin-dependent protein